MPPTTAAAAQRRAGRTALVGACVASMVVLVVPAVASAAPHRPHLLALSGLRTGVSAQSAPEAATVPGQVMVRWKSGVSASARTLLRTRHRVRLLHRVPLVGADLVAVPSGATVASTMRSLTADPNVASVQPNFRYTAHALPCPPASGNDYSGCLWGLENVGQNPEPGYGAAGVPGVDINAQPAWAQSTAGGSSSVLVGVIDTGIDFNHPDLNGQIWTNPGETGLDAQGHDKATNGLDDDGDGKVDDVHGWDFYNGDNSVYDNVTCTSGADAGLPEDFHGTHVAGTIAARNDGAGVIGVAYGVRIMPLKALGCAGGDTSTVVDALAYAKAHGVRVVNMSLGGTDYDQAFKDAIDASGILVVAAAGNGGSDGVGDNNDVLCVPSGSTTCADGPSYPASFDSPNIISVAAVNNGGLMSSFSNYGRTTVDVSAPGESVLSSIPPVACSGGTCYFAWLDGTSMATPHVTGVAALLASAQPSFSALELKWRILSTVRPLASTSGRTVTGGIVDAAAAVTDVLSPSSVTVMSLVRSTSVLTYGQSVALSTQLKGAGLPKAGHQVWLLSAPTGSSAYSRACTVVTNGAGRASCRLRPARNTVYKWAFVGDPGLKASHSALSGVVVRPVVSVSFTASTMRKGTTALLRGRMYPTRKYVTVVLQRRIGTTWVRIGSARTNSTSGFAFGLRPPSRGTYVYRVLFAGDSVNGAQGSSARTLKVT